MSAFCDFIAAPALASIIGLHGLVAFHGASLMLMSLFGRGLDGALNGVVVGCRAAHWIRPFEVRKSRIKIVTVFVKSIDKL